MEADQYDDEVETNDWWASIRLATVVSIVAGLAALLLAGRIPETTLIVSIIVVGTMVSWFHLEDHTPTPTAATVRYPRKHRD